jgi:hypothetical protein
MNEYGVDLQFFGPDYCARCDSTAGFRPSVHSLGDWCWVCDEPRMPAPGSMIKELQRLSRITGPDAELSQTEYEALTDPTGGHGEVEGEEESRCPRC